MLGKYIFRPDMSKLLNLEADKLDTDGSLNLTGVQKTVLLFLFLLVLLLLFMLFRENADEELLIALGLLLIL